MHDLPRFTPLTRLRPVALVAPGLVAAELSGAGDASEFPLAQPAPSVALEADLRDAGATGDPAVELWLGSAEVRLAGHFDPSSRRVGLSLTTPAGTSRVHSRRHGRVPRGQPARRLGLTLTGSWLTVFTSPAADSVGDWTARGRLDLREHGVDVRDEAWLAALRAGHTGPVRRLRAGAFGQLGLRDLRLVSHPDGSPYLHDGGALLSATSAGPGFFGTAHTSVWRVAPDGRELTHLSDVFFRREDRPGVYADHASHLVRDGDEWLVATSTWGDFDDHTDDDAEVHVTVGRSRADLLSGRHVIDTATLRLPAPPGSVGLWDPHLVRSDGEWLVGYVSASRFFRFHPVVATGPDLDHLALRAAASDRRATEGTTLVRNGADWLVLASDGRDGRRGQRAAYPVFDLDLRQHGTLDAPYPSNLPWPTLVPLGDQTLLVGFDGQPTGGPLPGYGTHGGVVIARGETPQSREGSA